MVVKSQREIVSLVEASEQHITSEVDMNHMSSRPKASKANLGSTCQIYEAPSNIKTRLHNCLTTPRAKELQQKGEKISPPKLNLEACQNFESTSIDSKRTFEQQVRINNVDLHKYKSKTKPSKVEYVDAWQTFVVDVDSSNKPHDHEEWVNGVDMQLQICK